MAELLGQHRYQLDAKGRVALPGKFRDAFEGGVFLTLGEDGCLYALPQDEWERRRGEIRDARLAGPQERARARMFFGNAERVDLDGQGRLLVPQKLRSQVGMGREVVVIGVSDWLEVWPAEAWERYEQAYAGAYSSGTLGQSDR